MSQPSRPWSRGPAQRRRRQLPLQGVQYLEERCLLAPVLSLTETEVVPLDSPETPPGVVTETFTLGPVDHPSSAAPLTSVSQLTPMSAFGNDIVRIQAGPGGEFGKGIYAISRGAGINAPLGAINRPGTIYRVDPTTGQAMVFFDLNTVINQLQPGTNASNSLGEASGLVNWYDMTFDAEGYFDGRPSLFVSSVDRQNPLKNAVYRIAPDGTLLGAFVIFSEGQTSQILTQNPSAIFVPPVEQQSFLRGLFVGDGTSPTDFGGGFTTLFFDANTYRPGQNLNGTNAPAGVAPTNLTAGPQLGFTSSSFVYPQAVYSVFTDFGTPAGGGLPARPGLSGVQGLGGGFLVNNDGPPPATDPPSENVDEYPVIGSDFRRFTDIAYDHYGYFAYGFPTSTADDGFEFDFTEATYAGNMFVADFAQGLAEGINPEVNPANPGFDPPEFIVPVSSGGSITVITNADGTLEVINNTFSTSGRIVRITPEGDVSNFAEGFRVSGNRDGTSLASSDLSITFSADGTSLYAADADGIWEFRTVASLAYSQTGQVIGLADLRARGIPYEGQDQAVHVVDTGVDALSPPFRGRVTSGTNIFTNGFGSDDLTSGIGTNPGDGDSEGDQPGGPQLVLTNGHGTPLAGVVAQFVPQSTINPVSVVSPFLQATINRGVVTETANAITTNQALYEAFQYVAKTPFVGDPLRPGNQDRAVTMVTGIGTVETYDSEGTAYRRQKQLVIAFKNQLARLRRMGIAPIAAAGQFGIPSGNTSTQGRGVPGGEDNDVTGVGGDVNGLSLPAVLNEVTSVSGTYAFPFQLAAGSPPNDPTIGVHPRPVGPILLFLGDEGGINVGPLGENITSGSNFQNNPAGLSAISAGDGGGGGGDDGENNGGFLYFTDKVMAAVNRNATLDFVAPALNVPTFRARFAEIAGEEDSGDGNIYNVFQETGTSISAGIVAGSYSVVASALDYWADMNRVGATADAYLAQPVGRHTLDFGPHAFKDLSAYANPDGINAILQWTSVPVPDENIGNDAVTAPTLRGSTESREYSRVDIGNAIAAIEGQLAIQYLLDRGVFPVIDGNNNGLITAQEIETFVQNSATIGMAEAGAMARLLGGNAKPGEDISFTASVESPYEPDVHQRRFNFFDYAADGKLDGSVTIDQIRVLSGILLPKPDDFVVVDRQRSSGNGYLIDPTANRNYRDLQSLLPQYMFVPKNIVARYSNISPERFKLNTNLSPLFQSPTYTVFQAQVGNNIARKQAAKERAEQAAEDAKNGIKPEIPVPSLGLKKIGGDATKNPTPTPTQTETKPGGTDATKTPTSTPTQTETKPGGTDATKTPTSSGSLGLKKVGGDTGSLGLTETVIPKADDSSKSDATKDQTTVDSPLFNLLYGEKKDEKKD